MHGQPCKQLVMGKPVKMLSNYNQNTVICNNRTEPEVHIDEHYMEVDAGFKNCESCHSKHGGAGLVFNSYYEGRKN